MIALKNLLLTDTGFYFRNELDKPLTSLIKRLKTMLDKPLETAKILFIPTASMQNAAKAAETIERLCSELYQMGIPRENVTIHDIDGSLAENDAMKFDAVYFSGGNTPYLAKRVRECGFEEIVKSMVSAGKVYIGMSAGSMLVMTNFNVDGQIETSPLDYAGLGLVNFCFTVHCEPGTENRTDFPVPHISLQCNQGIAVNSEDWELIACETEIGMYSDL